MPSSAAFEDSAISSEGEEDEESEVEEEVEEGEVEEEGEGGEEKAGEAETEGCGEDELPLMRTNHARASLEEFTLLERACCEERADCEVQGPRALSGRDGGGDVLVHARAAAPQPAGTSPTMPSLVVGKTEGAKPAPPSDPLPPPTAAAVHGASRAAAASARGAGIRGTSPVMPTVLDFGGAAAMRPSASHDVGAAAAALAAADPAAADAASAALAAALAAAAPAAASPVAVAAAAAGKSLAENLAESLARSADRSAAMIAADQGGGSPSASAACSPRSSTVKVPPLAVPQLGSCASSGRAWRLWAARHS